MMLDKLIILTQWIDNLKQRESNYVFNEDDFEFPADFESTTITLNNSEEVYDRR
jgi:hypothetical protein